MLPSSLLEFSLCWKYVIYLLVLQGGGSQLRDYLDIQMDFELLSKAETWRTTRTSEVGLNTFCIMRQSWTFEGQGMECGDVSTKCPLGSFIWLLGTRWGLLIYYLVLFPQKGHFKMLFIVVIRRPKSSLAFEIMKNLEQIVWFAVVLELNQILSRVDTGE